ncbi:hypothetical protein LTR08_008181 [Meristemomyces frigidus]|nr:hypothetical protein LTR08_008181 [Meristemomyces frigidus]
MTAPTASFTHVLLDFSNAISPLATVFLVWNTNTAASSAAVQIVGTCLWRYTAIVIGLCTYGYNVMRNLGNRLTLHSSLRGSSMEFGNALTDVVATLVSSRGV